MQSTIVVPSYIRPALPADLPNVLVLDEEQRLTPEQAASVGFYVRPYYQAMGAEEFAGMAGLQVIQTLTAGVDDVRLFAQFGQEFAFELNRFHQIALGIAHHIGTVLARQRMAAACFGKTVHQNFGGGI